MAIIRDKETGSQIWRGASETLVGVNLQRVRLRYADLRRADLRGADLRGTNLWGADLREADLRNADLSGAVLWNADLRGADLRCAKLEGAILCRADFHGANLAAIWLKSARADQLTRWPESFDPRSEQVEIVTNSDPRSLHSLTGVNDSVVAGFVREKIAAQTRPAIAPTPAACIPDTYFKTNPDLRSDPAPSWSIANRLEFG